MPSHSHSLRCRLYLGRLPSSAMKRDVETFFRGYGKLVDINLRNGYGFVEFENSRDADDACHELNGKRLCGERIVVEFAKGPPRSVANRERNGGGDRDRRDRKRSTSRDRKRRSRSRSRDRRRQRSRSRSPRRDRRDSRSPRRKHGSRSRSRSADKNKAANESTRVEVTGLPEDATVRELEELMASAGKVVISEMLGEGKAVVEFSNSEEASSALTTLGVDLELRGSKLTLSLVQVPAKRHRSKSPAAPEAEGATADGGEEEKNGKNGGSNGHHHHADGDNGNDDRRSRSRSQSVQSSVHEEEEEPVGVEGAAAGDAIEAE